MPTTKKRPTQHRILVSAKLFHKTVICLPQVGGCDPGRICPRVPSQRGIALCQRDFDLEAKVYGEDGIQDFHLKPACGTSLEELMTAIEISLTGKYTYLEEEKQAMKIRVTNDEDMRLAKETVEKMAAKSVNGHVVGIFAELKNQLGWDEQKATAAIGNLLSSNYLVKITSTILNKRKVGVYCISSPVQPEEQSVLDPSAETELAGLLAQDLDLAHQIVEAIWFSKGEKADNLRSEMIDLTQQRDHIEQKLEEDRKTLKTLEEEIQRLEVITQRLKN